MHIFDYSTINFRLVAGEYVKEKREKKHTHTHIPQLSCTLSVETIFS